MKTIAKALVGDDSDSHARFLEVIIKDFMLPMAIRSERQICV
jgi:hypothetical protein